jgi:hypothetical protein
MQPLCDALVELVVADIVREMEKKKTPSALAGNTTALRISDGKTTTSATRPS